MKSIEMTGKTVEDAVSAGVKALGCDPADVQIDVLDMGSPGLFGMFGRLAKVRLTVKEDESFDFEMPEMSLNTVGAKKSAPRRSEPKSEPKSAPRAEKPAQKAEPAAARVESAPQPAVKAEPAPVPEAEKPAVKVEPQEETAPRAEKPASRPPRRRPAREEKTPAPLPERVPFEEMPVLDMDSLSDTARSACEFLKKVTAEMGASEVEMRVTEAEGNLNVAMMGDELGILIGRRGETLDALQYLTGLYVNKHRSEYVRVSLDSENYRGKREEALTRLAGRMAARARKTGRKVTLEPMNPYERRILHSALQADPDVTTHSEGEEPYRRVIITLK